MRRAPWSDTALIAMGVWALLALPFAVVVSFADLGSGAPASRSAVLIGAWPWVWATVVVVSSACGIFVLRRYRGR